MKRAACERCGVFDWVNGITYTGENGSKVIAEICAVCFDATDAPISRPPGNDDPSWRENSNPWLENAVRALEEDR